MVIDSSRFILPQNYICHSSNMTFIQFLAPAGVHGTRGIRHKKPRFDILSDNRRLSLPSLIFSDYTMISNNPNSCFFNSTFF